MGLGAFRFRPRLVDSLRGYRASDLPADISAGITVGIVALPLAMAFGIASGVRPEQGLFTAIIGGLLVSLLGGTKVQIGGPAGAFVALLYAIGERYGIANLLIATLMAGVLLFLMGALKLGSLVRFVPVSIIVGFTNGIAVVIALQQVKDFLGLAIDRMPANSLSQLHALGTHLHTINPVAVAIGIATLVIIIVWPKSYLAVAPGWRRWLARAPGTIAALVLATLAVKLFGLQVETVGSRFGGIPQGLPVFALPAFDWQTAQNLVAPTLAIALLGAIESLLCARMADSMIDDRHDPNQELMAQGMANFIVPFFGGIAVTGTIARTVTNIRSGARSPIAGVVHALTLLAIVLLAAPLASDIPMAALAGILLFVAWNMGEWRAFPQLKQFTINYRVVMLATFLLTVIFDLTVAVEVGLVLASLLFIVRIASVTRLERIDLSERMSGLASVEGWRLFGSLFFGSVNRLEPLLDPTRPVADITVLDLHQLINLDTTGLDALQSFHRMLDKRGKRLVIVGANTQPLSLMERSGFTAALGDHSLFDTLDAALAAVGTPPAPGD
ncbi:MAG: STAS domain-containing protein [Betaproteobacteria bacterium]|nr:STAS domain-containing protein [Betaproteobacteria bacterium]